MAISVSRVIGRYSLSVPAGHIYEKINDLPPLYDYGPWSFIACLIS